MGHEKKSQVEIVFLTLNCEQFMFVINLLKFLWLFESTGKKYFVN